VKRTISLILAIVLLVSLAGCSGFGIKEGEYEKVDAKLAACFVFRYWYELGRELAVKFAAASIVMIAALGGDMAEAAKKFSAEVEYDPDNVEKICDFLETHDIMLG